MTTYMYDAYCWGISWSMVPLQSSEYYQKKIADVVNNYNTHKDTLYPEFAKGYFIEKLDRLNKLFLEAKAQEAVNVHIAT